MRTLIKMKLIPGFLTTALFALACEKPPNPAAPKRAQFSMQDDNNSRITGGGKLDGGRDFATFGFNARDGQGQIEWVQHCLDGIDATSDDCSSGSFTFHGSSVTAYGTADDQNCRAWSGDGEAKFKESGTASTGSFSAMACDLGQPGRGTDTICFMFGDYAREGMLTGGNIQLHKGTPEAVTNECTVVVIT